MLWLSDSGQVEFEAIKKALMLGQSFIQTQAGVQWFSTEAKALGVGYPSDSATPWQQFGTMMIHQATHDTH